MSYKLLGYQIHGLPIQNGGMTSKYGRKAFNLNIRSNIITVGDCHGNLWYNASSVHLVRVLQLIYIKGLLISSLKCLL